MSVLELESGKVLGKSEDVGEEVLSLALMKEGDKVLAGMSSSAVAVWRWGEWTAPSDRLPGHVQAVNCLWPLDSDTYLSASDDGLVRLMQIHPNRIIAVVGGHAKDASLLMRRARGDFPVEHLGVDRTRSFCATSSHDGRVKFFDLSRLSLGGEEESEGDEEESRRRGKRKRTKSKSKKRDRARRDALTAIESRKRP